MSETNHYFLCPYCATKCSTFEELRSHVVEQHKAQPPPMPEGHIRLAINGQEYTIAHGLK